MKKTGKRLLSWLLVTLLVIMLLPLSAVADATDEATPKVITGTCGSSVQWELDEQGTLTISGSGAMADYSSASDAPWYTQRASIKEVKIVDGVTAIGYKAFCHLSSLTAVIIPTSVTEIGGYAFYRCSGLPSVAITKNVKDIGTYAFYGCSSLKTVIFHGAAPNLGEACFGSVTAKAYYPCSDTSWKASVRSNYGGSITWEEKHSLVNGVCTDCQTGQTAKILHSGTYGDGIQWELDDLGTLTISGWGSMRDIGQMMEGGAMYYSVFHSYAGLITNLVIKEGVTRIGDYAFNGCSNIVSVILPKSVKAIGTNAFKDCSGLKCITYLGSECPFGSSSFGGAEVRIFCACTPGTSGSGKVTWGGHFFDDYVIYKEATCTGIAKATGTCVDCGITTDIEVLGTATGHQKSRNGLCMDCGETVNIKFIMDIDYDNPWGWDGSSLQVYVDSVYLRSVYNDGPEVQVINIPYTSCQNYVFVWNESDSYTYGSQPFQIWLNDEMLVAGEGSYYDDGEIVHTLESTGDHQYEALNTTPTCTEAGITGNTCVTCGKVDVIEAVPATGHSYMEAVTPATCTENGSVAYTCTTCDDSYSVATPATGHQWEDDHCSICGSEEAPEIVSSGAYGANHSWTLDSAGILTVSGNGPLGDRYNTSPTWSSTILKQTTGIVIENGVTAIGGTYVFERCKAIAKIDIPQSVTRIGASAFYRCEQLETITIPESVITLESGALSGCKSLRSVVLPSGLTQICQYTFSGCSSLRSIEIPEPVTMIGKYAFSLCSSLEAITIPKKVTDIGEDAFKDCTALRSITFLGAAPTMAPWCFRNVTAVAFYPCGDGSWTEAVKEQYGGRITWVTRHTAGENGLCTDCGKAPDLVINMTAPGSNGKVPAVEVYADGELLGTATTPEGNAYQTGIPFYHDKTYTFRWASGPADSLSSFSICANGQILAFGVGSDYSDGQIIYTIENQYDHEYTSVVTPPACTEEGYTTKTCRYCGYVTITDITPATGHSCEDAAMPPTCTDAGFASSICSVCGYSGYMELPATGHHYDAKGLCVDCGIAFMPAIYMTDTYGDGWNGAGIAVYTDDVLLTTISLSEGLMSGNEAVAYVPGKTYTFKWKSGSADNECGFKITLNGEMLVSGLGSSYSDGQTLCSFTVACDHVYEITETPPTCTEEGVTMGNCTVCGYSGVLSTAPATGHDYVDGLCTVCHAEDAVAGGTCGTDLRWRLDHSGTLIISGTGPMDEYDVPEGSEDPDTPWYEYRQLIKGVEIRNGVTTIGKLAFYNCTNLTDVKISQSVTTIGSAAFRGCSSLTDVTLPEGVTDIGKIVFYDCTALTEITIPGSVTSIGQYAFGKCGSLTTVTFLGSAPSMDSTCFVNVTATACYPCSDETWTDSVKLSYGGKPTWTAAHSFGDYVPNEDATCTMDGTMTRICGDCAVTETQTVPGTATGHTEETVPGIAATCTENGLTDGVKCSVCNEVLTAQETISATGHDYRITVVAGTCTSYGYEYHECLTCGDFFYNRVTAPTGHKYVDGRCECGAELLKGDVTGDGKINIGDVAKVFAHVREASLLTDENALACADVTGDGKINMGDVAKLFAEVRGK